MKTALITAASKGIGFATAQVLLSEGVRVIISSSNETNLKHAFEKLNNDFPGLVFAEIADLRDRKSVKALCKLIIDKYAEIDVLINNCGGPLAGYYEVFEDSAWDNAYEEIFTAARILSEAFLPGMKRKKWGRIVNITSVAVKHYIDNLILSTSMRSALTAYTIMMSKQIAEFGITINNVAPGYTLTERIKELAEKRAIAANSSVEEILRTMEANVPAKRFANPQEIADAVGFLTSEKAGYITGNTLLIDGGLSRSII